MITPAPNLIANLKPLDKANMKISIPISKAPVCLMAGVLSWLVLALPARAAAPALTGRVVTRALTPGEITNYKLPATTEVSGGLTTLGVGSAVYLEVDVNIAIPPADILGVSWVVTNKPVGSSPTLSTSPLGTNVPVYEPTDRLVYQVAGRTLLRADVTGQYTVVATMTTASEGTTNVSLALTVGKYMGVYTCFLCHGPGSSSAPDKSSWQTTAH